MTIFRILCLCLLFLITGCAVNTQMVELPGHMEAVVRDSFRETATSQKACSPWVDADVNVSLEATFFSGAFDGYLQAMTPAYLKFVGTNPFGQPLLALVSDGKRFQYLSFSEQKFYEGDVAAKAFSRFTPPGFDPVDGFYWFIGRLGPGEVNVVDAGGDVLDRGRWVELLDKQKGRRSRILFDPERKIILDHVLLDSIGGIAMQVEYRDHQPGKCGLPGTITITGEEQRGRLVLRLSDWKGETPFAETDFKLEIPAGFRRVAIQ
ncbi:MAG: DUF4292 domain-containing protein [Proteobacteria bacterium]|nr:DUF4292 domain-containing protein [Pseudomonadota bacterium]MBU1737362.1 DUF4292 domain-containing protein [Pseudomonadota bacterium]